MQNVKQKYTDCTNKITIKDTSKDLEKQLELQMINKQKNEKDINIAEESASKVLVYLLTQKEKRENEIFNKKLIGLPKIFADYLIRKRNLHLMKCKNELKIRFLKDFNYKKSFLCKSKRKCTLDIDYESEIEENFNVVKINKLTRKM